MELREHQAEADPHCADHSHFSEACSVCKQARANSLPYPLRKTAPLPRSFGFTDNINDATFRQPRNYRINEYGYDPNDPVEASLSLMAIRFILRLIWPFSRII